MFFLSPILFTFALLCSAIITSFENDNALPVPVTHTARNRLTSFVSDPSYLAQFRSTREALTDPTANYTDGDIESDPTLFNNIAEYEFLQALSSEGIDSSEDILESRSDTKYEDKKLTICDPTIVYLYYKCYDPEKKVKVYYEYKGLGYCPPRLSHRPPSSSLPRGVSSTHGRTFSSQRHRSHVTLDTAVRYTVRNSQKFTGYRYLGEDSTTSCKSTHGQFLQQIVSEFSLKGKKEKYQMVIDRTFQRIRKRYNGFQYVIQSETYEKNGKVFVKFFFNEKHTGEAEL